MSSKRRVSDEELRTLVASSGGDLWQDKWTQLHKLALDLLEARQDAERYQWLRTSAMIEGTPRSRNGYRISWPTISADPPKDGGNYRDRFDAAIDAARQKEGK